MTAIFYVLHTGCQWKALPRELGAPSTVHDRFQEWRKARVFEQQPAEEEPQNMSLDEGYDYPKVRELVATWGYTAYIYARGEGAAAPLASDLK